MVNLEVLKAVASLLKDADRPLSFNEIVVALSSLGVHESDVADALSSLLKIGAVKGFLREEDGNLKVVYVLLG